MSERSNSLEMMQQRGGVVTPWTINSLEGLSLQQVELSNQLLSLLPRASLDDSAFAKLSGWLQELTGRLYKFELYRLGSHAPGTIPTNFGDSFSTWFELPPDLVRGAILIDQQIVEDLVSGLLEQPTVSSSYVKKTSDPYHWGLVLYVLSRMVEKLGTLGLPPLLMGTDQLAVEDLKVMLEVEFGHLVEVVFVAKSAKNRGLVRLLLPGGIVQVVEMYAKTAPGRQESREFVSHGPFADLPLHLPIELGRATLTPADVRDLERDDVIFLSQHGLETDGLNDGGGEHGRLQLNSHTFLSCAVFEGDNGFWNARIVSDDVQKQSDSAKEGNVSEQSDERTSYLAGSANVTVEVRVGQVSLSVAELTRLQSGHVMVLERDVARGVDLVADGRIIGSGELVNVEGALGVRVQWMGVRS